MTLDAGNIPVRGTRALTILADDKPVKRKRKPIGLIIFVVIWILGAAGLFLYPTVSEYINNLFAKAQTDDYNEAAMNLDISEYKELRALVDAYNNDAADSSVVADPMHSDSDSDSADGRSEAYEKIAAFGKDGQIGNIHIPSINCNLPIYKGTDESKLDEGAQHMYKTSLPSDGSDIHVVVSAHTAFPSKELFNHLIDVKVGDDFVIDFLGDTYSYRVTEINVVLPEDGEKLQIQSQKNLCTLVTCTPYSVNSHRLLVTGELTDVVNRSNGVRNLQIIEEVEDNTVMIMLIIGGVILMLTIVTIIVLIRHKRKHGIMILA